MRFTLAADGASDAVLLPILTCALKRGGAGSVAPQCVDFGRIPRQPGLREKLRLAVQLYPCDVLFVHRDAEGQSPALRRQEVGAALDGLALNYVPVVPVRMTEAWLLADERAIRSAAGNPTEGSGWIFRKYAGWRICQTRNKFSTPR